MFGVVKEDYGRFRKGYVFRIGDSGGDLVEEAGKDEWIPLMYLEVYFEDDIIWLIQNDYRMT